jgi:hypothetical protein
MKQMILIDTIEDIPVYFDRENQKFFAQISEKKKVNAKNLTYVTKKIKEECFINKHIDVYVKGSNGSNRVGKLIGKAKHRYHGTKYKVKFTNGSSSGDYFGSQIFILENPEKLVEVEKEIDALDQKIKSLTTKKRLLMKNKSKSLSDYLNSR